MSNTQLMIMLLPLTIMTMTSLTTWLSQNQTIFMSYPLMTQHFPNLTMDMMLTTKSTLFSLSIILISSAALIYSKNYIPEKENYRFQTLTLIFVSSMIVLTHSTNMLLLMLGWDGLGLSSYLLVVYYQNHNSNASGTITLLSNRIGDVAFIAALSSIHALNSFSTTINHNMSLTTLLLFLTAAITKSAQFPFSAWLPAAMAAPTPISALVHSSTLVTAGLYLMMLLMSNNHPHTMYTISMITITTLLLASLAANYEKDFKKVIAYSTLSQISLMMFSISMNNINTAYFHMITHAFFKSTMFLAAGILIHSSSYQDSRLITSQASSLKSTKMSFTITNLALIGLPFMSGFYSKDAILELMMHSTSNKILMFSLMISLGMTASYSIKMVTSAQSHNCNPQNILHASPLMKMTLIFMTPLSITLGTMLMWNINPLYYTPLPPQMKMMTPTMILAGLIMGFSLQHKNMTLYKPLLTMLYQHSLSATMSLNTTMKSHTVLALDNTWNELLPHKTLNTSTSLLFTSHQYLKMILPSLLMLTLPTLLIM